MLSWPVRAADPTLTPSKVSESEPQAHWSADTVLTCYLACLANHQADFTRNFLVRHICGLKGHENIAQALPGFIFLTDPP